MISKLVKKLDAVFSQYIRLWHADDNGIVYCFTCGAPHHWTKIDNGHHCKRQFMSTRFDEINCQPQCRKCNWLGQGEDAKFRDNLIKKYGQKEYDLLLYRKGQTKKWSAFELEQLIQYYTKLVNQIKI